jgi:hypothetical protein
MKVKRVVIRQYLKNPIHNFLAGRGRHVSTIYYISSNKGKLRDMGVWSHVLTVVFKKFNFFIFLNKKTFKKTNAITVLKLFANLLSNFIITRHAQCIDKATYIMSSMMNLKFKSPDSKGLSTRKGLYRWV